MATHAVIMAGGGGTRLWPASRRRRPKQFLPLGTHPGQSLLAETVARVRPLFGQRIWVVTAAEQADAVREAVPELAAERVVSEPAARNTAAALGLAAAYVRGGDPDAVIAALPSDHHVADEEAFRATAAMALAAAADEDAIITIGLKPTRPETGYGYLEIGDEASPGVRRVVRFVEKPDRETACGYLESGRFLWNGGMFFFRADRLLAEIERHLPDTATVLAEIEAALRTGGAAAAGAVAARTYPGVPPVSIDYGVMEKVGASVLTVPGDFGWNDVGSWAALADYRPADADGNVVDGTAAFHDARGNVVVTDPGTLVALVGVEGLVVVRAGDAVLVLPRERAQDAREIVRQLERRQLDRYT